MMGKKVLILGVAAVQMDAVRLRLGYLFDIGLCTAAGGKESITDLLQLRRSWRSAGDDMAIFNYSTVICVE